MSSRDISKAPNALATSAKRPKAIFEIEEWKIGGGFYVKVLPRYEQPMEPVYGFKTRAEAEAWIEADRAKHRPGRRPKLAAN